MGPGAYRGKFARTILRSFTVWAFAGGIALAQPEAQMAKDAHPSFEVATIKLSDPDSRRQGIGFEGSKVHANGQTVKSLMMFAYGVHGKQIVDEPGWASTDKYDILGQADVPGEPNLKQLQEMFQRLFTERFGLALRREKREMGYYAILVARAGAKIEKTTHPENDLDISGNGQAGQMEMKYVANQISDFALGMQYFVDRPLVDETGLQGRYDFMLKWKPDTAPAGEGDQVPGLFTAMQEQLGLKLEAKKGPVEVLAIEHVGRPSAN